MTISAAACGGGSNRTSQGGASQRVNGGGQLANPLTLGNITVPGSGTSKQQVTALSFE
ncbi:MAG: hypothetical protein ACLQAT_31420 [Candidatus Binataceae bacterium]